MNTNISLVTFLLLLTSCSTTVTRKYEPINEIENERIYRNNSKASKIIQDDIQTIIQFKEKINDTIYISAQMTNNSQKELLITPKYFSLYSENKIVSHFSYEEDLERISANINVRRNDLKTNTVQDIAEISEGIISIFQKGEEYENYEERRIQNKRIRREKKHELDALINKREQLLKNYPIKYTLLKNETKQFLLKFKLKDFPSHLRFEMGNNPKSFVTFKIL